MRSGEAYSSKRQDYLSFNWKCWCFAFKLKLQGVPGLTSFSFMRAKTVLIFEQILQTYQAFYDAEDIILHRQYCSATGIVISSNWQADFPVHLYIVQSVEFSIHSRVYSSLTTTFLLLGMCQACRSIHSSRLQMSQFLLTPESPQCQPQILLMINRLSVLPCWTLPWPGTVQWT